MRDTGFSRIIVFSQIPQSTLSPKENTEAGVTCLVALCHIDTLCHRLCNPTYLAKLWSVQLKSEGGLSISIPTKSIHSQAAAFLGLQKQFTLGLDQL